MKKEFSQQLEEQIYTTMALLALLLTVIIALSTGASNINLWQSIPKIADILMVKNPLQQDPETTIFLHIRLPRVLAAALCGAALASAGVISQGLFRNALASPSVLGSSSGASFAAVCVFYLTSAWWEWFVVPLACFLGSLSICILLIFVTSRRQHIATSNLLLIGIAFSTIELADCSIFATSLSVSAE